MFFLCFLLYQDPYIRKADSKEPEVDEFKQIKLRHGDVEVRFHEDWPEPFPLQPGETVQLAVKEMQIVGQDTALRLRCKRDFTEVNGDKKVAGDEWLFVGPGTYVPRIEVDVSETVRSAVIEKDHALKLRARKGFTDRSGRFLSGYVGCFRSMFVGSLTRCSMAVVSRSFSHSPGAFVFPFCRLFRFSGKWRKAGEEWLVKGPDAFMPFVDEAVVGTVLPNRLSYTTALHLRATDSFTDAYKIKRNAGDEWLVTNQQSELHIQDVYEEKVGTVAATVLSKLQYCVVRIHKFVCLCASLSSCFVTSLFSVDVHDCVCVCFFW